MIFVFRTWTFKPYERYKNKSRTTGLGRSCSSQFMQKGSEVPAPQLINSRTRSNHPTIHAVGLLSSKPPNRNKNKRSYASIRLERSSPPTIHAIGTASVKPANGNNKLSIQTSRTPQHSHNSYNEGRKIQAFERKQNKNGYRKVLNAPAFPQFKQWGS